jgi:hypothetical protein
MVSSSYKVRVYKFVDCDFNFIIIICSSLIETNYIFSIFTLDFFRVAI